MGKHEEIIKKINAVEPKLRAKLNPLRRFLDARKSDENDALFDYEMDMTIHALNVNGEALYSSLMAGFPICYETIDSENWNEHPLNIHPDDREYHSFLYHDLTEHSVQSNGYGDSKVGEIHSLRVELEIWDQIVVEVEDSDQQAMNRVVELSRADFPVMEKQCGMVSPDSVEVSTTVEAFYKETDPDYGEYGTGVDEDNICYRGTLDSHQIPEVLEGRIDGIMGELIGKVRLDIGLF